MSETKNAWEHYMDHAMQAKGASYPHFRDVIDGCLQGVKTILDETGRSYLLRAYVRWTDDQWEENVVHLQMQFQDTQERDALWNHAGDVVARCVRRGLKEAASDRERREIENILCAIRSV
jgi:hypothetical protein